MSNYLVVDVQSGTYFDAEYAMVVDRTCFDACDGSEESLLDSDDDSAIAETAERCGYPALNRDAESLTRIAELLNGSEWTVDMLDDIANILREQGRTVDDVSA